MGNNISKAPKRNKTLKFINEGSNPSLKENASRVKLGIWVER